MKSSKPILKINASGELIQFNERLNRWEYSSRAWSWSDISPEHLKESRKNWKNYEKAR